MTVQALAKSYFEVENRAYRQGTVVTFADDSVGGWVVDNGWADDTPAVVAAAISGGAAQVTHTAGFPPRRRAVEIEDDPNTGSPTLTGDAAGAVLTRFDPRRYGIKTGSNPGWRFQDAIDDIAESDALRGALALDDGDYYTDEPFYIRNRTGVVARGPGQTRLMSDGDFDVVRIWTEYTGGNIDRAILSGLTIRPNAKATSNGETDAVSFKAKDGKRIWKPIMLNVSVQNASRDALSLMADGQAPDGTKSAIAEHYFHNLELTGFARNGYNDNAQVYDHHFGNIYADSPNCTGYGLYIRGGSGDAQHLHAVGCGYNDGAGNYTGGSVRLDGGYWRIGTLHSDRPGGHGLVIGGYGADPRRRGIRIRDALLFNAGVYYNNKDLDTVVRSAANLRIGAVEDLEIDARIGELPNGYPNSNGIGVSFESTDIERVRVRGNIHGCQTAVKTIAGIDATKIRWDVDVHDCPSVFSGPGNSSWTKK